MKSFVVLTAALASVLVAGTITTGQFTVENGPATRVTLCPVPKDFDSTREVLQNRGFESGSLTPWSSSAWVTDSTIPHTGHFCACDVGNYNIQQNFRPMPGSVILDVTFYTRHPDSPAAMAYDFLYSDGSSSEYVITPAVKWTQYDVTSNLNRSKTLTGLRLWGYSGGGPGPDSTYVDDVSILRWFDVVITAILAPTSETLHLGDTITPAARMRNNGILPESVFVWCRIEHTESSDVYRESVLAMVSSGTESTVVFPRWTPRYTGRYRFMITFDPNDTSWHYFWVEGAAVVGERHEEISRAPGLCCSPSIGPRFVIYLGATTEPLYSQAGSPEVLDIYSSSGALVWSRRVSGPRPQLVCWDGKDAGGRQLQAGVYLVRLGSSGSAVTRKLILTPSD